MNFSEELKWRGLINDVTDEEVYEKLENGELTFYLGADPTADSLHVGHLFGYLVSKRFMEKGNKPILIIGGATGLIGDPRPNRGERDLLTLEQSLDNAEGIMKQVKQLLPNAKIVNNYDWISKIDMITFLRDYGKNFNINYMINKETVKSRLETGISYTEFSYMLLQSIDFMHLYESNNCRLQVGGQDQWGNMTAGLEMIRKNHGNDDKPYVLTWPLITKSDGTKFGKTEGGSVWLDPLKTTPYEFYQFWYNTSDNDAILRLKQFTFLSVEETQKIIDEMTEAPHLRSAQKEIAKELTILVHGEEAYLQAIKISKALFSGNVQELTAKEISQGFKDVPSVEVKEDMLLVDLLIAAGLAKSKRESREFISNNAISVNGEKVADLSFMVKVDDSIDGQFTILRRGRKKYVLVKH